MNLMAMARVALVIGIVSLVVAGGLYLLAKTGINIPLGRLPGDFRYQSGGLTCFFPLATTLLLSLILTVVVNVIARLLNR